MCHSFRELLFDEDWWSQDDVVYVVSVVAHKGLGKLEPESGLKIDRSKTE
jgi:hypothetical protein